MSQAVSIQSCLQNGNIMGALKHAEMWIIQESDNAEAWFWRGTVQAAGRLEDEAIKSWQKSIELMPDHRGASHNLTIALMKSGQLEKAKEHLLETKKLLPQDGQVQTWLGHVLSGLNEKNDALDAYRKAILLSGRDPQILKLAAMCARDLAKPEVAVDLLGQALEITPNDPAIRFEHGCMNLALGNYKAGFADYESRWARETMDMPNLPMPLWQGEDIQGKHILIHDEQGMGDTIMFSRFIPQILEFGCRITFWVRPRLARLIRSLLTDATCQQIKITDAVNKTADIHCPLLSLPHFLKIDTEAELLGSQAYLSAEENIRLQWQDTLRNAGEKKKVGLIWQGDPSSQAETGRSKKLADYLPHLRPDSHYFLLQCLHGREEIERVKLPENVTDLGMKLDHGNDAFIDTAAVMDQLDLVITTDTGPAHLAGALGVRTHLILQKAPEWRWGFDGSHTPWYQNMILFRDNVKDTFNF
ncbi:hypothetical protein [Curvivirga sp.]|uniref:hypothetical protein n=1 Tax=Curvivirga sp. TaxID=2856848 RepID=UPI003B59E1A1